MAKFVFLTERRLTWEFADLPCTRAACVCGESFAVAAINRASNETKIEQLKSRQVRNWVFGLEKYRQTSLFLYCVCLQNALNNAAGRWMKGKNFNKARDFFHLAAEEWKIQLCRRNVHFLPPAHEIYRIVFKQFYIPTAGFVFFFLRPAVPEVINRTTIGHKSFGSRRLPHTARVETKLCHFTIKKKANLHVYMFEEVRSGWVCILQSFSPSGVPRWLIYQVGNLLTLSVSSHCVGSEVHFYRVKVENRSIIRLAVKYSTRFGARRSIRFTFFDGNRFISLLFGCAARLFSSPAATLWQIALCFGVFCSAKSEEMSLLAHTVSGNIWVALEVILSALVLMEGTLPWKGGNSALRLKYHWEPKWFISHPQTIFLKRWKQVETRLS